MSLIGETWGEGGGKLDEKVTFETRGSSVSFLAPGVPKGCLFPVNLRVISKVCTRIWENPESKPLKRNQSTGGYWGAVSGSL